MDECHRRVASPSPVCIVVIVEGGLDNERLQPLLMQIFGLLLRLMLIQIVDVWMMFWMVLASPHAPERRLRVACASTVTANAPRGFGASGSDRNPLDLIIGW